MVYLLLVEFAVLPLLTPDHRKSRVKNTSLRVGGIICDCEQEDSTEQNTSDTSNFRLSIIDYRVSVLYT